MYLALCEKVNTHLKIIKSCKTLETEIGSKKRKTMDKQIPFEQAEMNFAVGKGRSWHILQLLGRLKNTDKQNYRGNQTCG